MSGYTPLRVDMPALLKPISEEAPSGPSISGDLLYDQIKEARREDDPALSQGVWRTELKQADWKQVAQLAVAGLSGQSKDLRLAVWLTEAWLELHGPMGAEQGLRLIESLCNRFWDTLHPPMDDGELARRLAPLRFLGDKVSMRLKRIPLTRPKTQEPVIYTWADRELATMRERTGQRVEGDDEVTTSRFESCVMLTPSTFYSTLSDELETLWAAVGDLEKVVDRRCGQPQAVMRNFRNILHDIREFVARTLDQKIEEEPGDPEAGAEEDTPGAAVETVIQGPGVRWGPIRNRAEAYQRLQEASDYLMRVEPHSPTPHLVRRAVSWGNMSFTELVMELVQDKNDLRAIYNLLGLEVPNRK